MSALREIKQGPFCWQSKAARRAIREALGDTNNVSSALGVYDALTEISSDAQSETFTTTLAWIQRISGVSIRTIQGHLKSLVALNLVTVSTPKLRTPSTYSLLSMRNDCATSGNDCVAMRSGPIQASLPASEESLKNQGRISEQIAPVGAGADSPAVQTSPKQSEPRPRNLLIDALTSLDGSDPAKVTKRNTGKAVKALAEIRPVCPTVTPEEILRRAANYRAHMPGATISALALSDHWAKCDRGPGFTPTDTAPRKMNFVPTTT